MGAGGKCIDVCTVGSRSVIAKLYPWYYVVNDRPVKIMLLPDGGADCLVFGLSSHATVEKVFGRGMGC